MIEAMFVLIQYIIKLTKLVLNSVILNSIDVAKVV